MRGESAEAYMDDVSVGTDEERSHVAEESKLLDRLLDSGLRLNFSKCAFGKHEVESLGHKISHNAIRPSDGHVDAMKEFQELKDGDSLCRFIGVANYFSRHIPILAQHLLPLHEVLVGSSWNEHKFKRNPVVIEDWNRKWGDVQRKTFFALRALLSDPVVLAAPRHDAKMCVEMDASDAAIGGLLLQLAKDDVTWEPLAFTARKLQPSELKFSVTEKECVAVVYGMSSWRHLCKVRMLRWLQTIIRLSG
jgi:RNase H-like domain found in reverse transcriptase